MAAHLTAPPRLAYVHEEIRGLAIMRGLSRQETMELTARLGPLSSFSMEQISLTFTMLLDCRTKEQLMTGARIFSSLFNNGIDPQLRLGVSHSALCLFAQLDVEGAETTGRLAAGGANTNEILSAIVDAAKRDPSLLQRSAFSALELYLASIGKRD